MNESCDLIHARTDVDDARDLGAIYGEANSAITISDSSFTGNSAGECRSSLYTVFHEACADLGRLPAAITAQAGMCVRSLMKLSW